MRSKKEDDNLKTGFDMGVCKDCAYNDYGTCMVNKRSVFHQMACPNGYTWEEIRDVYADIIKRIQKNRRLRKAMKSTGGM